MDNFIASSTSLSTDLVTNIGLVFLAVMSLILFLVVGVWAINYTIKKATSTTNDYTDLINRTKRNIGISNYLIKRNNRNYGA